MIVLKPEFESEIRKHGEATWPNECCGIFLGTFGAGQTKIVTKLLPIENAKDDGEKHNRFLITPDDLMRAEFAARKEKLDVLGFYHSHPDHPAKPSQFDLDHALPFYSYVIVAVEKKKSALLTSWELENDRSRFNPETILQTT